MADIEHDQQLLIHAKAINLLDNLASLLGASENNKPLTIKFQGRGGPHALQLIASYALGVLRTHPLGEELNNIAHVKANTDK